jgi:competence ComEA-like helix-hairpin-helix protein
MRPRTTIAALLAAFFFLACVLSHAKKEPPSKPIDLNAASAKELQELPGVGPVTAQRILDLRAKNGKFKRVEDLLAVRGISQTKLDAIRPYVTVSAPPASTSANKGSPAAPAKKP